MTRSRRRFRVAGIIAVIALAAFVLVLHLGRSAADRDERHRRTREQALGPKVAVVAAKPAPPARAIVLPADVFAVRVASLYARVSGYLVDLRVDRGDRVRRGQLLGVVATPETESQLEPLVANLARLRAIAERLRSVRPTGGASQQDVDRAEADVHSAQSEVDRLRVLRGFQDIVAPFDGVITRRYVNVGALMPAPTSSTETAQPLVDVADPTRVRVVVNVGQRDAHGIQVGDPMSIARDADPQPPIVARVTRTPGELDLRTRTMWVEAELDNPDGTLVPGTIVRVTLQVRAPPGVVIPAEAIAIYDGKPHVAVVRDDRVRFVAIEVSDDDGRTARVTQGLSPGDWIAWRLSDELADGALVRPIVQDSATGAGIPQGHASSAVSAH